MSSNTNPRREFFKKTAGATLGLSLAPNLLSAQSGSDRPPKLELTQPEWRNRQDGMEYRMLGRTGMMVSEMVVGGYGLKTADSYPILDEQLKRGMNYVDAASGYHNGQVESNLGEYFKLRGNRDEIFLSTKLSSFYGVVAQELKDYESGLSAAEKAALKDKAEALIEERRVLTPGYHMDYFGGQQGQVHRTYYRFVALEASQRKSGLKQKIKAQARKQLEESLKRLQTDHVDVLHCPHGIAMPDLMDEEPLKELFTEFKQDGLIRASAVSFHNDVAGNLSKAIEVGYFDLTMFAYNIANHAALEPLIYKANQAGMGTIAMKVAKLFSDPETQTWRADKLDATIPETNLSVCAKAYLWALQNPNLSCVISQMESIDEVAENASLAGRKVELKSV
ncbi:aldo/keto reductase [Coraliomargarita akajimensis]|uniref:Oxidoreductase (Related to aryl-alcohol dehydrogenase)-like protein n=1 Tax=Coraliomargarita akajimensis (strain DSM 45221 / IAM 15411 / JCM 23193 / KCTC 12865 / 04OKA010-24) TaxID=583355 RepID=D5ENY5_CORAD|nr:aldo/keto reductase [Coraliomargarita akajimensis]ADE53644.1 oxidoreductase (related to aryl-alcohol dehydrogenase)-like protein [Coraliomargarita akajimensis DSM 45221]